MRSQVDGFVGAHLARALQRQISNVGGDDARRAGAPQAANQQRTDRATAGDQHLLAQHAAGALNRMQANRQGFGQRRLRQAQVVSHRMRLAGTDHQLLAEGALNMRERHGAAVKAHVQAMVVHAGLAKAAAAARP